MRLRMAFYASLGLGFIMICLYNIFTPYFSDDLSYLLQVQGKNSFFDLVKRSFQVYMEFNPRIVGHFITYFLANISMPLFNILNSGIFVLLIYLIYRNVNFGNEKKYDAAFLLFCLFFFWRYAVDFGDTMLWLSGTASYLWPMAIMLAFILFYRHLLASAKSDHNPLIYIALFFLAVFAGWSNENTSGGTILLILIFTAIKMSELKRGQQKRIRMEMIVAVAGVFCGFIGLLASPGAYKRLDYSVERHSGIVGFFSRLYKCFVSVHDLFFELFVIFIIVTIIAVVVYNKGKQVLADVMPFFFAGIATAFVLVLIPQPTTRAFYGAGVFLVIACLKSFEMVFHASKDKKTVAFRYIIMVVLALWLFFDYQANLVNLARINREENERIKLIEDAAGNGEKEVIVPKYREENRNRYSSIHNSDMTDNPKYWINWFYSSYYGVDEITAIPRPEWDELAGE